jgi:spermidine synthase
VSILPKSGSGNLGLRFSAPAFLLGFLASSFQIFLLREFSAHFFGNELTFGLVLAAWLFWGGLGSLWASKRRTTRGTVGFVFAAGLCFAPIAFVLLRFSRFILGIRPGEMTGLAPVLLFALILAFVLNAPLGILFASIAKVERHLPRVYFWESGGAVCGGMLTYLVLIPALSNWQALAAVGVAASLAVFVGFKRGGSRILSAAAPCLFILLFFFDLPAQKICWEPLRLTKAKDSLYGKLQVIQTAEQMTLYNNGLKVFSFPDPASAEEAVHFALLQRPRARRILLIGGGAGGGLNEILKYPGTSIDYIELDPEIIRISRDFWPSSVQRAFRDPRVRVHAADGRIFIEKTPERYDAVILDLPEPSNAQLNRFYTREFFRAARKILVEGGVFSFRVPSAENYIGPELQRFLATMFRTLGTVFPVVKAVPGTANIFLASDGPLSIEAGFLAETIRAVGIKNIYVTPELLPARLHPLRLRMLAERLEAGPGLINTDLHPASYYFSAVLWSTQFRGLDASVLEFLAGIPGRRLLDGSLLLFAIVFVIAGVRSSRSGYGVLPMMIMGLTTMAVEIMVVIWYQTLFGCLYRQIALLLTTFMAGLALGAFLSTRRKKTGPRQLLILQFGFLMLVLIIRMSLEARPPEGALFAFLFLLGCLGGDFFIVTSALFFQAPERAGVGYGLDLLGSFLAAVGLSSILIPLLGLPVLFQYLFLLNSFLFLFVVTGFFPRRKNEKGIG